ncbi:MAG: hypothetical protein ACQEVA_11490 [Myxococcota bacterium]
MNYQPSDFATHLRRTSIGVILICAVTAGLVGCDEKSKTDAQGERAAGDESGESTETVEERTETVNGVTIVYKAGSEPTPDTVLAEGGDIEVTMADFERAMSRSLLLAPKKDGEIQTEVPAERLAVPNMQISVVRRLLASKVVEQAAEQRGIEATTEEKVAALESHRKLTEYADLIAERPEKPPPELAKRGLTVDEIDAIAHDIVVREKLQEALLAEISEQDLWEAYQARQNTVKLALSWVRNTPRSATIDAFVREQEQSDSSEITQYYQEQQERYRRPTMLEAVILAPEPGTSADKETLEEAAKRLADEVDYEKIADELGLELDEDARLVRQENKEAFGSDVGETGYEMSGPRGAYAWRVTGFEESRETELTSGLQRQIAAEILRSRAVVPTAAAKLTKMRRAMKGAETNADGQLTDAALEALGETADQLGLEFTVTKDFVLSPRGFIPGVGLAREVSEAAEDLTMDQPLADRPILSREKAYIVRLQDKHTPTRAEFEDVKDDFRERYIAEQRRRIIDRFVAEWEDEHDVQLDVGPVQVKYGVAQKD